MCDDLVSFTFIFHVFSQFSTVWRCSWRLREAVVRSAWVANIAVSSANDYLNPRIKTSSAIRQAPGQRSTEYITKLAQSMSIWTQYDIAYSAFCNNI